MLVHRILATLITAVTVTACTATGSLGAPGGAGGAGGTGVPGSATSAAPKDPDAVWVAVVGDSILAPDCYTCSPVVIPSSGGAEEIRPVLAADPHIFLADYDARFGATTMDHTGFETALTTSPDELVVDLYPNDAAQIALGRATFAQVEARIVAMADKARAAGVDCLNWVTYQSFSTHIGPWELLPGWATSARVLRDFVVGLAASRPDVEVLDFGSEVDGMMATGTAVMDTRDWVHYRSSTSRLMGRRIRERVLDGRCTDAAPIPDRPSPSVTPVTPGT